jgi:hypothetical protein
LSHNRRKEHVNPRKERTHGKAIPTDADKFFEELAKSLGKRSLIMIKSTLRRSIRRAQVHNLIDKNVIELTVE